MLLSCSQTPAIFADKTFHSWPTKMGFRNSGLLSNIRSGLQIYWCITFRSFLFFSFLEYILSGKHGSERIEYFTGVTREIINTLSPITNKIINNVRKSEHMECVVHCVWCLNPLYSKGCWVHFLRNGNRQAPVSWINSWGSAAFNFQGMHSFTVITSSPGFISSFCFTDLTHFRIGGGWGLILSEGHNF